MSDPVSHASHVGEVIEAALREQRFGQDFGYAVTWAPAPTPQGVLVGWAVLVTLRSPLLGQPPFGNLFQCAVQSVPPDDWIAAQVAAAVEALRAQAEQAKHPPKPIPAGLAAANGRRG